MNRLNNFLYYKYNNLDMIGVRYMMSAEKFFAQQESK